MCHVIARNGENGRDCLRLPRSFWLLFNDLFVVLAAKFSLLIHLGTGEAQEEAVHITRVAVERRKQNIIEVSHRSSVGKKTTSKCEFIFIIFRCDFEDFCESKVLEFPRFVSLWRTFEGVRCGKRSEIVKIFSFKVPLVRRQHGNNLIKTDFFKK